MKYEWIIWLVCGLLGYTLGGTLGATFGVLVALAITAGISQIRGKGE